MLASPVNPLKKVLINLQDKALDVKLTKDVLAKSECEKSEMALQHNLKSNLCVYTKLK